MPDANYQTSSFKLANGGLVQRHVYDAMPPNTYWNMDNLESREEGALSSRFGLSALTTDGATQNFPLGAAVNSLSRMQGIGTPYRYAGTTAGSLFRRAGNTAGVFTQIASGLSGGRMSMSPYRPANSSAPWQFIADAANLVKDNGLLGTAENWGIVPPVQPALIAPVVPSILDIELFDESVATSFTTSNLGSPAMGGRLSTAIQAVIGTGVQLVTIAALGGTLTLVRSAGVVTATITGGGVHNYVTGMRITVSSVVGDQTMLVSSVVITVTSATTFTYVDARPNSSTSLPTVRAIPAVGMSVTTTDGSPETVYITEVTPTGFVASFASTHLAGTIITSNYLSGTVAANATATVSKSGKFNLSFAAAQVAADANYVQLYFLASNPLAISQVSILFDVGDGSFTQDYYSKAVVMSTAQPLASGTRSALSVQTAAVSQRAIGGVNFSTLGGGNPGLLPSDMPLLQQLQPTSLDPGANVWTLIQVPLSQFVENGAAGGPNNGWSNIVTWRIQIQTNPTLTTTIGLDDLVFVGGSDLNSFAGQPYDYRYTYTNLSTGCESNPSMEMIATDPTAFQAFLGASLPIPLAVQQQAIQVTALASPDAQVTHWNLYRRGGSLTQAWYFVAQIPIGALTFVDTIADSTIEINSQLQVDSDAPVTTLLPIPLNGTATTGTGAGLKNITISGGTVIQNQLITLDVGILQEQMYVQFVSGNIATVFLQFDHGGHVVPLAATTSPQTAMNLSAIVFDQAWLAGDPNNPHVLYYSRTYSPETFPSENFIEVGTPDAPIMALVVLRGLLYVFTTKTVWQIFGGQGSVPIAVPTGVMHGLVANWAWAASENVVYYESYDGIYVFTGSGSTYLTQNTEWIWTNRTETNGVIPVMDPAEKANTFMAYGNHEVFVAYIDVNDVTHRQILSDSYQRWRNDDQAAGNITAMFFEQDTGMLVVGKDDGMVYLDRVNDFDDGGWVGGVRVINAIPINLQTPQLDLGVPKAFKQWAELTIDATLPNGLVVGVTALFDSQATVVSLGNITGTGSRAQYQININNGLSQRSLNMGLNLTGSTTAQAIFHEIHVRALVEAEYRRGWDTYWMQYGSDEWHLYKQVFAEYAAPDPAGITVNAYVDGNFATPAFTFTLPQSVNRTSVKVRFPATKCRLFRCVGTSSSDFQIYPDTQFEWKALGSSKGYQRGKLQP